VKLKALVLSLLIPMAALAAPAASAASVAVQQIAEVLLNLDKAPTPAQREVLKPIADGINVTADQQKIAQTILNMDGTIKDEDKKLLWSVLRHVGASEDDHELARVLNKFDTKATEMQQRRLSRLLPPKQKKAPAKAAKETDKKSK
jgi:hypothetical protein